MLNSEYEFRSSDDGFEVWHESDLPPYDDIMIGRLKKNRDGYYRFHASEKCVMTCKALRTVMCKVSELNREN